MPISEAYLDSLRKEILEKLDDLNYHQALREKQLNCDHVWIEKTFYDPCGRNEYSWECSKCADERSRKP